MEDLSSGECVAQDVVENMWHAGGRGGKGIEIGANAEGQSITASDPQAKCEEILYRYRFDRGRG